MAVENHRLGDHGTITSTDFANANKYHAQITAAHIGAGNIGGDANIGQLLLGIQAELRGMHRELRQLTEGDIRRQDQLNRLTQLAGGSSESATHP